MVFPTSGSILIRYGKTVRHIGGAELEIAAENTHGTPKDFRFQLWRAFSGKMVSDVAV
jgi:hypothetical protein